MTLDRGSKIAFVWNNEHKIDTSTIYLCYKSFVKQKIYSTQVLGFDLIISD